MEHVFAAFPKRPLRITWFRQTIAAKVLAGLGFLVLAAIFVADAMYILPAVVDDVRYRDAPYASARPLDGECQSKLIISICDVKLEYRPTPDVVTEKELHMLYFFGDIDTDRPFVVHMPPGEPDHISTSWGQAGVVNRSIAQLALFAGAVALVFAGIKTQKRRNEDAAARERIGQRPQPTFVTVVAHTIDKRTGMSFLTYTWETQGRAPLKRKVNFPKGTAPFMLDATHVLALTDGSDVTVMDSQLANVDLSQQERDAVIRAKAAGPAAVASGG